MVITTCQHCGAVHSEPAERCSFCDARFDDGAPDEQNSASSFSRGSVTPTAGALAMQPEMHADAQRRGSRAAQTEWKQEVRDRLRAYRMRRGIAVEDSQTELPFEPAALDGGGEEAFPVHAAPTAMDLTPAPLYQQVHPEIAQPMPAEPEDDRVEIAIPGGQDISFGVYHPAAAERTSKLDALLPVAGLPERRRAAAIDAVLILFSFGAMLSIFWVLGGRLGLNKVDEIVTGIALALFYAQYFALFTIFGASTPGMMLRGLRVISFEGATPTSGQRLWRSFGYLISAGTCMLGFLWALWDEDHLCWHDRISQTYLTAAEESASESILDRTDP